MKYANCCNIVRISVIVSIIVSVFALSGCRPDSACRSSLTVGLTCEFREIYIDELGQEKTRNTWDSLTVQGVGSDSLLYANRKNIQKIVLPMRHDADSTIYVLTYHGLNDTLIAYHTSQEHFISVECGCVYNHELVQITYTKHWADSLAVINNEMNRGGATNLYWIRRDK